MERYSSEQSLGYHALLTFKAFYAALESTLKPAGVSASQHIALIHLVTEGPMPQAELAGKLSISPPSAVKLIDRMERDGWVQRQEDPTDRRVKRIVPTEKTAEVWEEMSRLGFAVMEKAYRGIDPADIETVKRVLRQTRENLET